MPDPAVSRRVFTISWMCRKLAFLAALSLASCATVPELGGMMDRGGTKGRKIVVSLKEQKATLYHLGEVVAVAPISSGREGKASPVGSFSVIEKDIDHRSSLYGNYVRDGKIVKENVDIRKGGRPAGSKFEGVPMPYFLRFSGAMGCTRGKCRAIRHRAAASACRNVMRSGFMRR